jgi:hypothetical protein
LPAVSTLAGREIRDPTSKALSGELGLRLVIRQVGDLAECELPDRHSSERAVPPSGNLLKIPKQRTDRSFGGYAMHKTGLDPKAVDM